MFENTIFQSSAPPLTQHKCRMRRPRTHKVHTTECCRLFFFSNFHLSLARTHFAVRARSLLSCVHTELFVFLFAIFAVCRPAKRLFSFYIFRSLCVYFQTSVSTTNKRRIEFVRTNENCVVKIKLRMRANRASVCVCLFLCEPECVDCVDDRHSAQQFSREKQYLILVYSCIRFRPHYVFVHGEWLSVSLVPFRCDPISRDCFEFTRFIRFWKSNKNTNRKIEFWILEI